MIVILAAVLATVSVFARQNNGEIMIEAKTLYNAFKQGKGETYKTRIKINCIASYVGPDVYALPSVELSESSGVKGRSALSRSRRRCR